MTYRPPDRTAPCVYVPTGDAEHGCRGDAIRHVGAGRAVGVPSLRVRGGGVLHVAELRGALLVRVPSGLPLPRRLGSAQWCYVGGPPPGASCDIPRCTWYAAVKGGMLRYGAAKMVADAALAP